MNKNKGFLPVLYSRVFAEDTGNAVSISQPPLSVFTIYSEFLILKQFRYPLYVSLAPVVRYNLQMCTDIITAGLIPAHNRKYLLEQHPQKIRGGLRDLE